MRRSNASCERGYLNLLIRGHDEARIEVLDFLVVPRLNLAREDLGKRAAVEMERRGMRRALKCRSEE